MNFSVADLLPALRRGPAELARKAERGSWVRVNMRAQVSGIDGDCHYRLRCCAEQQIVDCRLVLECDIGRYAEHDLEVADRQRVGLAGGEPFARAGTLASVIDDAAVAAFLTALEMAAEGSGAASLDRHHDLELIKAQVSVMGGPIGMARSAESISDFE